MNTCLDEDNILQNHFLTKFPKIYLKKIHVHRNLTEISKKLLATNYIFNEHYSVFHSDPGHYIFL